VSPLSGGIDPTRTTWSRSTRAFTCMRLPGQSTELLSDRSRERGLQHEGRAEGLHRTRARHVPGLDVMVLEFIPGPTMSAETLQSVHMARAWPRHSRSAFRTQASCRTSTCSPHRDYLRIVDEHGVVIPRGYPQAACGRGDRASGQRARAPRRLHAHNDLLCENFIDDGASLRSSTTSSAATTIPCFDLGNTAQEAISARTWRDVLCEA